MHHNDPDAHAGLIAGRHTQAVRIAPEPRTTRRRARQMDRIATLTIVCALLALAYLAR